MGEVDRAWTVDTPSQFCVIFHISLSARIAAHTPAH